jgi:uncharacterized protein (DUF1330 family)
VSGDAKRDQVERLRPDGFADFAERTEEGPIVMLNLLAFEPEGGEERYAEYAVATAPMLERAGGRLLTAYRPAPTLIGDDDWDLVALVEYPTRGAFLEMIASDDYQAITHMRTESLRRGALVPMDPAEDLRQT